MNSKEALKVLYNYNTDKGYDGKYFKIVEKDLDRLEKLEEFASIVKGKLIIYKYDNIYDDSTFYFLETIDKNKELTEKQKDLVKEVLEDE